MNVGMSTACSTPKVKLTWLSSSISEFLLLVTILVFMTSHVQFLAGKNPKPIRIIYAVIAAVFAVIMLAYIALDCYNFTKYYYGAPDGLYRADNRLGTAYYTIYLVILIVAVITLIIRLVQMNSHHIASGVSPSQPNTC